MKITRSGKVTPKSVNKSRKSSGGGNAAFSKEISDSDPADSLSILNVGAAAPLASIDALLALQEAPTSTEGRSKGLLRANIMLDSLEELRRGLLLGSIPFSKLKSLSTAARERRANVNDSALEEILTEIELRAEVELAKLGM